MTEVLAPETEFGELKRYVGFGPADEAELAALQDVAERRLPEMLDAFYGAIESHPGARAVFADPEAQIPRLRRTLGDWVRTLLRGPYDDAYARKRAEIGRAHVRYQMPQRYMLTAMNVVRRWFAEICFDLHAADPVRCRRALAAVERILDIELSIMLGSYRDDLLARMQRQERLATIGELAAGIHHELKNPLAAIAAAIFALGERRAVNADPRARALLERVRDNADRASEIITDMLSFARLRDPSRETTRVEELVERAISRVSIPPRCRVTRDLDPALPAVRVDGAQVEQALVNLLTNAFEACPDGGHVRVASRMVQGQVELAVADDGVGIGVEDLHRVFEPLFSTKPEGVGLGLSLSRHLVQANGGDIRIESRPGEGTTVTVNLPA